MSVIILLQAMLYGSKSSYCCSPLDNPVGSSIEGTGADAGLFVTRADFTPAFPLDIKLLVRGQSQRDQRDALARQRRCSPVTCSNGLASGRIQGRYGGCAKPVKHRVFVFVPRLLVCRSFGDGSRC